jgi:hypothetical protein
MKYVGNPVVVDAFVIVKVHEPIQDGTRRLDCAEGKMFRVTPEMTARYTPVPGDYVVVQADGYEYINPKEVFERKYSPVEQARSAG